MSNRLHIGQRWISETEPELGMGTLAQITPRAVSVSFPATGETRQYAIDNAPLRRVRYRAGDTVQSRTQRSFVVQAVVEHNGLLTYRGEGAELCETELNDTISFNQPDERLLNGHVEPSAAFALRCAALDHQHRRRKSAVRGFIGGRIDLIPHQLYIAPEVAGRLIPRVLLADEVGLGKTIEACLILHRLIQTGRAQRALVLVPEPLVHQWFVELLRRFNLWFHIFDEARCDAIETANPDENPFLDDQFVLCGIDLLAGNSRRAEQAIAAPWDILVVDEAHHLGWSPDSVSPEYALVEALGRRTPGLLLLTATPEQLGVASHFARLRLLDADRYFDLNQFIQEAEQYRSVAVLAEKLLAHGELSPPEARHLAAILRRDDAALRRQLERVQSGDDSLRTELIQALLDQHGTGRVMFRNTRATMTGFPPRTARLIPLAATPAAPKVFDQLADEFAADTGSAAGAAFEPALGDDPRVRWLADFLRALPREKVLLICRTRRKVEAIDAALRKQINLPVALFHEGLPLVQRDRNAAWFAEDEGARVLMCSEIGSEGRNFQFAHHLVLFDLPLDPELLEQRIGRLDRIGQTSEIHVHVPFVTGSSQEVLARWYHEGLNAFARNLRGGRELLERFGARVRDLAQDFHETQETAPAELEQLIATTRAAREELAAQLEQGRDRLLELNSFRPEIADQMVRQIRAQDADPAIDAFMLAVFDHFGIHVEELGARTFRLGSAGVFADSFPGLPADGLTVTSDRSRALAREDIQFLSWDHPLVTGAMDLLLGAETGNSAFAHWPDLRVTGLYLEAVFVLECIAPPALHLDRFLPPTPVRVIVDHRGEDQSALANLPAFQRDLRDRSIHQLLDLPGIRDALVPQMLAGAAERAERQSPALVARAREEMNRQLGRELQRLRELQQVNRNIRAEEIETLGEQQRLLDRHLAGARLRLDAIRVIQRGPA